MLLKFYSESGTIAATGHHSLSSNECSLALYLRKCKNHNGTQIFIQQLVILLRSLEYTKNTTAAATVAAVVADVGAAELAVVTVVVAVVVGGGAEQLVIESGMIAVIIFILPFDNFWLNSVQTQIWASQVSEKI